MEEEIGREEKNEIARKKTQSSASKFRGVHVKQKAVLVKGKGLV